MITSPDNPKVKQARALLEPKGRREQGRCLVEGVRLIEEAMRGWLESELENGKTIPEPRPEEEYSGKFIVRVPKSLHRKLAEISGSEGVSLNQWINTTLAEAVGSAK